MFDKFIAKIQSAVASVVAWQVNNRYEKIAINLLEQVHTGASLEWISEIIEIRGRHALAVAHH